MRENPGKMRIRIIPNTDTFYAVELIAKTLRRLETCLEGNNKLYGKLVSLLPIMFFDNLKVTSVAHFVAVFNFIKLRI